MFSLTLALSLSFVFTVNSFSCIEGKQIGKILALLPPEWCNSVVHERAHRGWMGVAPCDLVYILSSSSLPVGWGSFRGPEVTFLRPSQQLASTLVGLSFCDPVSVCLSSWPLRSFSFSLLSPLPLPVYSRPLLFPVAGQQCLMLRNIERSLI